MKIVRAINFEAASRKAANYIFSQITLKPDSVLGLATGSSPVGIYENLIAAYRRGDLDFSGVRSVNLDEYVGLGPSHPQSYTHFMRTHLFDHINIQPGNIYLPNGLDEDAAAHCARYDRLILELGGIDLQLVGIGHNGHIGFNEPADTFVKGTHCVELTQSTIDANARFFAREDLVPRKAYTMGILDILQAKRVVMIACGRSKSKILKEAITGPVTPAVPASILQLHPDFTLVADEEALSEL